MIGNSLDSLNVFIGQFWWPFIRIGAAFILMPFFSEGAIPNNCRVLLAILLAILCGAVIPSVPAVDYLSFDALIIAINQFLIGLSMGLLLSLAIYLMGMLGQILSMQMGMSMSMMNDPSNGVNHTVLAQFMTLLGTVIFFSLDGHLVALGILSESFHLYPIGLSFFDLPIYDLVLRFSWLFAMALMLAIPAMITMLLVNIAFGFLNRSAPSFNIFALDFPMSMLLGLFSIMISLSGLPTRYASLCLDALASMREFVGG